MANVFQDPTIFAREVLRRVKNNLHLAKRVNRSYSHEFKNIGETVSVRRPVYLKAVDGPDITDQIQDIVQTSVDVTINYFKTVPVKIGVRDWNLSNIDFANTVIEPGAAELAQEVELALSDLMLEVPNFVGTPGTTPTLLRHLGLVKKRLDKLPVPPGDRHIAINSDAELELLDSLKGILNPQLTQQIIRKGSLGNVLNSELFTSQCLPSHTKGTASGTPLTNGANQGNTSVNAGVTTLVTDGWTASQTPILKRGDIFTLASINAINFRTKVDLGELRQFVVTANVNSDASGNATIPISPALNTNSSSPYQNASAAVGDGVAITVVASHAINMGFHRDAFTLVTIPIELPDSFAKKRRVTHDGISITISSDADIKTFAEITRMDIMFGVKVINGELAAGLYG